MSIHNLKLPAALLMAGLAAGGCGKSSAPTGPAANAVSHEHDKEHSHEGWWCNEHGVPEEVCAQCNSKLVAEFKAKGDWCKEHDRPDSHCFVCHPEKQAEFAAQYEAKYGTQPPKPEAALQ